MPLLLLEPLGTLWVLTPSHTNTVASRPHSITATAGENLRVTFTCLRTNSRFHTLVNQWESPLATVMELKVSPLKDDSKVTLWAGKRGSLMRSTAVAEE